MKVNHLNKLASKIAKKEGKKSQAKIGDIREILAILGELWIVNDPETTAEYRAVIKAGLKRLQVEEKKQKRGKNK